MKFGTVCIAFFALPLCFALSACEDEKPVKPAEWWHSHPVERAAKLAECKSNPGELQRTADCINAQAGENEAIRAEGIKEEEEKAPEEKATEEKAPEEKAPEEKAPEEKTGNGQ